MNLVGTLVLLRSKPLFAKSRAVQLWRVALVPVSSKAEMNRPP